MSLIIDNSQPYKPFNSNEMSIRRDDVFKIIFGDNSNKIFLKKFLEAILNTNITGIEIKNEVSLDRITVGNKLIKVDILAEINKKELINIEIQNKKNYNDIIKRSQAHASKIYYNSLEQGENYNIAKKTIIIWILDFNIFDDGPYHEISKMTRESNGKILSEDIVFHYFQLPKFYEQVKKIFTLKEQWLAYLACQLNKEELEELLKMNETIRDVELMARAILKDKELMKTLDDIRSEEIDKKIQLSTAYHEGVEKGKEKGIQEGIEKGIEQGEKENSIKIAKEMKKANKPINEIVQFTGLSKEEVDEL